MQRRRISDLQGGLAARGHPDHIDHPQPRDHEEPSDSRDPQRPPDMVPAHPGSERGRPGMVHVSDQHGPDEEPTGLPASGRASGHFGLPDQHGHGGEGRRKRVYAVRRVRISGAEHHVEERGRRQDLCEPGFERALRQRALVERVESEPFAHGSVLVHSVQRHPAVGQQTNHAHRTIPSHDMDTESAHRRARRSIGHSGMRVRSVSEIHRLLDEREDYHHIKRHQVPDEPVGQRVQDAHEADHRVGDVVRLRVVSVRIEKLVGRHRRQHQTLLRAQAYDDDYDFDDDDYDYDDDDDRGDEHEHDDCGGGGAHDRVVDDDRA